MYSSSFHREKYAKNESGFQSDSNSERASSTSVNRSLKIATSGAALIRVEEKRESYLWVEPEAILFVKSADHYVKALIQHKHQKKWALRHCTIKELLPLLSSGGFLRLNRFYIINSLHFSHFDRKEKVLYFKDGFSINISHTISRFVLDALL
jgi:DNA-binding LytR/AlgR family response regulator